MMKYVAFALYILLLGGCASSVYKEAANEIHKVEFASPWVVSVNWSNTQRVRDGSSANEAAAIEIGKCVAKLENAVAEGVANQMLVTPPPSSTYFATLQILNCMQAKGWQAEVAGYILMQ